MAATFDWEEDNGTAAGSPTKGTTRTISRTEQNWKAIDDSTTAYNTSSIVASQNSFEKWTCGRFTGTFNQLSAGLWAHTSGAMGGGTTIKGTVGATYTTPSQATNALLTTDMTSAIAIASGQAVQFGITGPEAAGKAASSTANPGYTQFLTHQLQTTSIAAAGDTTIATFTLQYNEN